MSENSLTHTFVLPSGIECEIKELTGKDQRILTEQKDNNFSNKLCKVLLNIVVRIGSKKVVSEEDVKNLLSEDTKAILWNARIFSIGEDFRFTYTYINSKGKEDSVDFEVNLSDSEEPKKYKSQWKELDDVCKDVEIVLPRSGKHVIYSLLDGNAEAKIALMKKDAMSSHSTLKIRNPREIVETSNGSTKIVLNLDDLSIRDIEYLRKSIQENEGKFHSEMRFEHPEASLKTDSEKYVNVDLIGQISFFFPSGTI